MRDSGVAQTKRRIAALVICLVGAVGLAGCHGSSEPKTQAAPSPTLTQTLSPGQPGTYETTGRGPTPPQSGAWLGAYADPYNQTSAQKVSAIESFEHLIGRNVAIVHSFHPWSDTVPSDFDYQILHNGQIDLLSWAGTDTISIASGVYDPQIKRVADALRDMGGPILLRFRWEMDRPNLAAVVHSPAAYITAWKHVRAIFTAERATNVGFVWCPLATGFATGVAQQYYPGDDQVDWLCTDVYPGDAMTSFSQLMAPVMQFASQHERPLLIGEFGVEAQPNGARASWFTAMAADLKQQPQIKAIVYFSENKRSKPIRDYTLDGQPGDLGAFKKIADDPYFQAPVDWPSTGG
ncbi:MAG TPA: beta-mannanase [Micromonosporaceae bacterium]|jgi:hypothetical protein